MNRIVGFFLIVLLLPTGLAFGEDHPLVSLLPGKPLVVLSGTSLGETYQHLASLEAVKAHAQTKDREGYNDSKLALKFQDRIREFSEFIGHSIRMQTLLDLAGNHLVLALYDIGNLQFVLVSDLDVAGQSALSYLEQFQTLGTRKVGQRLYFVKEDPDKGLAFALYRSESHLIVSNDVNLMEGVLQNQEDPKSNRFADSDSWIKIANQKDAVLEAPLLLYLDMDRLKKDRYFQYYWLYNNAKSFESYRNVVCGIQIENGGIRERRLVFGPTPGEGRALTSQGLQGAWRTEKGKGGNLNQAVPSFFGWPVRQDGVKQGRFEGLLYAVKSENQTESEMVHFQKGAAFLVEEGFSVKDLADAIALGIQDRLLIKKKDLLFQEENGMYSLAPAPSLPGAYLAKEGDILFAATDPELLKSLVKSVKKGAATTEEEAFVSYRDELPQWAFAFEQMGPDAAFDDHEIGYFFEGELAGLLRSAAGFNRYRFLSQFSENGVLIQTVRYEK